MIDQLTVDIPNIKKDGFKLIFSDKPFPKYQAKLIWVKEEYEGNWYTIDGENEGWLCPALLKYFPKAPKAIYLITSEKKVC